MLISWKEVDLPKYCHAKYLAYVFDNFSDLARESPKSLSRFNGIGKKAILQINNELNLRGLSLLKDIPKEKKRIMKRL